MKTLPIFSFRGASLAALVISSAVSGGAFLWPFFLSHSIGSAQWLFACAAIASLFILFAGVSNKSLDPKSIALLAILSALIAALRPLGLGAVGIEPMWFILIIAARIFGPSFGFLLGAISMFLSALLTGGFGPWFAYQAFAAAWIGLGVALVPSRLRGRSEIFALALYGAIAAEAFGIAMDLQFWPWIAGVDSQLSWIPGAALGENLDRFLSYHFLASMAWDIPRAIFTVTLILILAKPLLHSLRRAYTRAAFLTPIEFIEREKAPTEAPK